MKLYNSMTRKKEEFEPLENNTVKMYNCGPTVYNHFHIGNARNFVIFDTLRRYLMYRGYEVVFVQNFTDVDDKMILKSNAEGVCLADLAKRYIDEYYKDAKSLGIQEADHAPKATESIGDIIKLVKQLMDKGFAYETDGDVYFDTTQYKEYGKLSGYQTENLQAGTRITQDDRKKHPADFALWKKAKPDEPSWNSPWGKGRPGWHIECSVMSMKYLGPTIDIHSGGDDLKFPHHENEIAQSEAATGKPFVRFWLHNGFINVDNEKMSKSLGNFFTVKEILEKFDAETLRFFLISAHYRSPINFTDQLLTQSEHALERMYECLRNVSALVPTSQSLAFTKEETALSHRLKQHEQAFIQHMDDDLNTADAIADIFEIVKEVNIAIKNKQIQSTELVHSIIETLRRMGHVLGILYKDVEVQLTDEMKELLKKREQARMEKDYIKSDQLRDQLKEKGVLVEDTKEGQKVKYL